MSTLAPAPAASKRRIRELDGLRGISVLFVILFHTTHYSGYFTVSPDTQLVLGNLGDRGVQIFFVISGFIITRLLIEEHKRNGRISLKDFYMRRVFRILPAYWVYSIAVLLLCASGVILFKGGLVDLVVSFGISALFLSDIFAPSWFLGHTWSLSVEEQFYILFPLCFTIIYRQNWRILIMGLFLTALYLSSFLAPILSHGLTSSLYALYSHLDWTRYVDIVRFFSYQYIAAGVAMAIFWEPAIPLLKRLPILYYLLVILLIAFFPLANLPAVGQLLFGYLSPLLMASVVGASMIKTEYVGFLRWQVIQIVGTWSYSVYLWQQLFTGSPSRYGLIPLANPFVALPLLCLCSGLSYYFVERKFVDFGKRFNPDKFLQAAKVAQGTSSSIE